MNIVKLYYFKRPNLTFRAYLYAIYMCLGLIGSTAHNTDIAGPVAGS